MINNVQSLKILVVATKTPWLPVDGGRLVLLNTIEALAGAGHHIELVAPCAQPRPEIADALSEFCTPHLIDVEPRSGLTAAFLGLARGVPATIARHSLPAVRRVVDQLLESGGFDVIHAEQAHALPQTVGAAEHGIPVVHRAHNVESLLWAFAAGHRNAVTRPFISTEARRMSAWEVHALESTAATIALTEPDRQVLSELVPGATVHTIPAPFPAELPAGTERLAGEPAVVTLTSATWAPSRDAIEDLATTIWPTVRQRLPGAVLHVFGAGHHLDALDGVEPHPSPEESLTAFPGGAVVAIPERHPTGVPMKALEAWARGLPLLADEATAGVLGATDGDELVVARGADGYADALARLVDDDELRNLVVDGGRRALADRHDFAVIADHLSRLYRWAQTNTRRSNQLVGQAPPYDPNQA